MNRARREDYRDILYNKVTDFKTTIKSNSRESK